MLLLVHWPSELAGVEDYAKLMAPDLSETVASLIRKILSSPVTTSTSSVGSPADWGLYSEVRAVALSVCSCGPSFFSSTCLTHLNSAWSCG